VLGARRARPTSDTLAAQLVRIKQTLIVHRARAARVRPA